MPHCRKKWRAMGYFVDSAESIIRLPGGITRRNDLFGFVDAVAVKEGEPLVFLQVTSWANVSARLRKIQREETGSGQWATPLRDLARAVIVSGAEVIIEGWRKSPKNGRYECKEIRLTLEHLTCSGTSGSPAP